MDVPCLPQALEGHQAQEEAQSHAFAIPKQLAVHCSPHSTFKKSGSHINHKKLLWNSYNKCLKKIRDVP